MRKIPIFLTALFLCVPMTGCSIHALTGDSESIAEESRPAESAEESSMDEETQRNVNAAIGTWETTLDEDGSLTLLTINGQNEAYFTVSAESDELYFDEHKNLWIMKKKFSPDKYEKDKYVFEDGMLTVSYKGTYIIVMEKMDDSEDILGEYKITGGKYLDRYTEDDGDGFRYDKDGISASMSENKTIIYATKKEEGFGMTKDHITMTIDGEVHQGSAYRVEGDSLILINKEGVEKIYKRRA